MRAPHQKMFGGLLLVAVICSSVVTKAQDAYKQTKLTVTVAGTSSLADWSMTSNEGISTTAFKVDAQKHVVGLSSLIVTIPAESLRSGDSSMDDAAYAALKTDLSKFITFQLLSGNVDGNKIGWNGKLTIAGVARVIDLEATCIAGLDHSIQIQGSKTIDMRAFGIEPPTFMSGAVKADEKVIVSFSVTLIPTITPLLSAKKKNEF